MTATKTIAYTFATDSNNGKIEAVDFSDACRQLDAMLTPEMIRDGANGWVENVNGWRYRAGNRESAPPKLFPRRTLDL